ncbi:hypothetical protein [Wenxinia marina]|uniref:GNAT family N-acetyltransferase n=1 Tax=Wenxinia marina DSM 24838 TaxID=1123501 RepID=A0A0D0PIU8_9RHOB|nr:hypothetical protein [Wenxinia marina]KIQ71301.1 hypothetical protein Wenmar_00070 [Wenxinia marina DSM 24838]GGL73720.1 N-acetyltransferase [Wenxinia marina]
MPDVRPLSPDTWDAYAALIERHKGVWGGCWCIGFHTRAFAGAEANRETKRQMVEAGTTHAALVFDGGACIGWAQYGPTASLPEIKNRKAYESSCEGDLPDWRVTCFFTDARHRKAGVSADALAGAVDLIARSGGGTVEGYPEAVEGQKTSAGFLYCGTLGVFERAGFTANRRIGKHRWVARRTVEAA